MDSHIVKPKGMGLSRCKDLLENSGGFDGWNDLL
jgi:hypothetical protein